MVTTHCQFLYRTQFGQSVSQAGSKPQRGDPTRRKKLSTKEQHMEVPVDDAQATIPVQADCNEMILRPPVGFSSL